jgi:hypothetical protein
MATVAGVTDKIVEFVLEGLKTRQVVMLSDLKLYLEKNNISYTDDDLQDAVQQLESKGIETQNLNSDTHCPMFLRME